MYCFPKGIEINIRVYNCLALRYYTTCILSVCSYLVVLTGEELPQQSHCFCLIIVTSESQLIKSLMTSLANPFLPSLISPSVRYPELSPSPADSHVYEKVWSHCGDDLFACLVGYDAASVHFYTTPPWGCRKSTIIAKITFVDITSLMMFTLAESLPVRPYALSTKSLTCKFFDSKLTSRKSTSTGFFSYSLLQYCPSLCLSHSSHFYNSPSISSSSHFYPSFQPNSFAILHPDTSVSISPVLNPLPHLTHCRRQTKCSTLSSPTASSLTSASLSAP